MTAVELVIRHKTYYICDTCNTLEKKYLQRFNNIINVPYYFSNIYFYYQ